MPLMQLEEDLRGTFPFLKAYFIIFPFSLQRDQLLQGHKLVNLTVCSISDNWFNNEDGALENRGSGAHELEPRSSSARPLLGKCVS